MRSLRYAILGLAILPAAGWSQSPSLVRYQNPTWSPDGKVIAFEANREGKYAVYTINFDGSGLRRLTSPANNDVQPQWSPDGKQIVFVSDRDGRDQVYVMNADGSGQHRVLGTPSPRDDFYASFSPDGRWIAFGGQDVSRRWLYTVHVMRADGTDHRWLAGDSTRLAEGPRWSKDGKRISYVSTPILERRPGESTRDFLARRDSGVQSFSVLLDGTGLMTARSEPDVRVISPDWKWRIAVKEGVAGALYIVPMNSTDTMRLLIGPP